MDAGFLLQIARDECTQRGYTLGIDFEHEFVEAIRHRNIIGDELHSEDDAIQNVRTLITTAIEHEPDASLLIRQSFFLALRDLCPLWPFC
jgi:hypothetical protein